MDTADGHGLPIALRTESASPAEVKLVEATLDTRAFTETPDRLIGKKGLSTATFWTSQLIENYSTEMISPHR